MMDAQRSCYNAVKKCFPEVVVLMCYFHVTINVLKHINLLSNKERDYEDLRSDIEKIHMTLSRDEYESERLKFQKKWSKREPSMYNYMHKQWFNGVFTQWQVWRNFPGYRNTNSNIESFNSTYKRDFSKRQKMSIFKALKCVFKTILYYSLEDGKNNKWFSIPAFDPKVKESASLIDPKSFKVQFKSVSTIVYTGKKTKHTINLDDIRCYKSCSCSCFNFNKWGICSHVVAYSYAKALDWYGTENTHNFILT
jgi:hypothetical protein